ncbi:MAG: OmpA family protein [Acidobacteriota bacterium]
MKHALPLALMLSVVLSSCVSLGKYEEMEASRNAARAQADSLTTVVARYDSSLTACRAEVADLKAKRDSAQSEYETLYQNYMHAKQTTKEDLQKALSALEDAQKNIRQREQRLAEVEQKLAARDSSLVTLKNRLADALLGFEGTGLTLNIKDGKLYVSLSNQLLFSTGKTEIDKRGKAALIELAGVLNHQKDISILVEGHTDNQPVANLGAIRDNWDLSVMRATQVVRYLVEDGKMEPARITASGRSEYAPLEEGNTPAARAKNRRTEIILVPKLTELFELLHK